MVNLLWDTYIHSLVVVKDRNLFPKRNTTFSKDLGVDLVRGVRLDICIGRV